MKSKLSRRSRCVPSSIYEPPGPDLDLSSVERIVEAYIRRYRAGASDEFEFFRRCDSLAAAIRYAALSQLPDGKRHPHQYRIPREVLHEGERNLQASAAELSSCTTFDQVHALVGREIRGIRGIGVLTVYDVATRLAAHRGFEPDRVYLHAGVTDGARALGLDCRRESVDLGDLPLPFRRLKAREIEDCLCIYKRELAALRS